MGVIWTRRTREKQPQPGATSVNRASPLTRGLTDAWIGSFPYRTEAGQATAIQTAGGFGAGVGGKNFLSVASGAKNGLRIASDFNTLFPSASAGTVILCLRHTDTTLRAGITLGAEDNSDHGKRILLAAPFSDGNLYWDWGSFSTGGRLVISGYSKTTAVTTLVATAGPSAGRAVWRDGVLIGSAASSNSVVAFTKSFSLGSADISGTSESDGTEFYMFAAYGRELSSAEAASVSRNPWQLFAPINEPVFYSLGGGAAALAGAAVAGAAGAGALSTAIPILGAAIAGATASGSLSTAISLAGATATIGATAAGDLTATIRLAGDAVAGALASGGLSTGIPLAGGGSVGGAGTGDLSTGSGLAGAGAASAAGTGVLTTQITLSGAAIAQAIASGALTTTPAGLAGDGTSSSSGSGALSTAIPLAGAAAVSVVGTGGLVTAIPLAGAATVAVSATGDLVVSLGLAGAALISAIGSGALLTSITFSGAGLAIALASGALTTVAVLAVDMPVTARIGTRFAARMTRIGSRYANGSRRIGARRTARG